MIRSNAGGTYLSYPRISFPVYENTYAGEVTLNVIMLVLRTKSSQQMTRKLMFLRALCHYHFPRISKNRTIDSTPRWKFGM
jgi:hypothetical protein